MKKIAVVRLFLFKRNEKPNRKDTLTPKCLSLPDLMLRDYRFQFNIRILSERVMIIYFISKCLEFIEPLICEKIVFTEILPKVLSITDLFLDSTTVNFPLIRTHKAFCFFHYLTPVVLKPWPARPSGVAREAIFIGKKT